MNQNPSIKTQPHAKLYLMKLNPIIGFAGFCKILLHSLITVMTVRVFLGGGGAVVFMIMS